MKKLTNSMPKILLALVALSSVAAFASTNSTVSRALNIARPDVKVFISGTVERAGKTVSLEQAEAVKSGEALDWTIQSMNEGAGDAKNYRVVGQIPAGTVFVAGSAKADSAPQVEYSIDGGKSFSVQPTVKEQQPDGSVKEVAAPVSAYTQVRFGWAKELASQAKFSAAYRVRVK